MHLPFICKNPIILSLLRTVTLNFTIHILMILEFSLKIFVIGKLIFLTQTFLNLNFNKYKRFLHNKRF